MKKEKPGKEYIKTIIAIHVTTILIFFTTTSFQSETKESNFQ